MIRRARAVPIGAIAATATLLAGCGGGSGGGGGDAAEAFTLTVTGAPEIVFDWTTDRCIDADIPDLPARAFRDASGNVQLISSHFNVRRFTGPDLDNVSHECDVVFPTDRDANPAAFNDTEWIASLHTEDGTTIHALVHNEYHGWEYGDCTATEHFDCWYNAITLAQSSDGGSSYVDAAAPPNHLVASQPRQYAAGAGPYGLFSPSNIIEGPGGYHYAFVKHDAMNGEDQWTCLMRTDDLSDPGSWRFWNGESFSGEFVNPYPGEPADADAHECAPVDRADIANMHQSVTFNTYIDRFVLVGLTGKWMDGERVGGIYYSFSTDLIEWSERELLLDVRTPVEVENASDVSYLYPSLLDPDSSSRNFETTGQTPYLYYTRKNVSAGPGSLDRDLIRRPVEFEKHDE